MAKDKIKFHALLLVLTLTAAVFVSHVGLAQADAFLNLPGTDGLKIPTPVGDTAVEKTESILGSIGRTLRIIVGAVAVLMITIAGMSMVISGDSEDKVKEQKTALAYAIVGLMLISIAGPIASIFDFRQGNILENPDEIVQRAQLFDRTTRIVITFIRYVLGALATAMFIAAGFKMVVGAHNEEAISSAKQSMAVGAGGILLIFISDLVVKRIFFDAEYNDASSHTIVQIDQNELIRQVVGGTNLMVSFLGPIMVLLMVGAGVLYITANGDEERTGMAKKIFMNSAIGIIIIYGAFALVSTIIAGVF